MPSWPKDYKVSKKSTIALENPQQFRHFFLFDAEKHV
jgi:hypothetical protein